MKIRNFGQIVLTAALAIGFAGTAIADGHEGGYPVSVSERPLTLDEGQVTVDVDFGVTHMTGMNQDNLTIGAIYGVAENFTVGATVAPLSLGLLDSEFVYGDPSIGALYRFMHGETEVGAGVNIGIPVEGSLDVEIHVPVALHMDALRIGTGLVVSLSGLDTDLSTGLMVPVELGYNVAADMHVALRTGIAGNLDAFGDTMTIPVGLGFVYTVADGDKPSVDVGAHFTLPSVEAGMDLWMAGVSGSFHFWM